MKHTQGEARTGLVLVVAAVLMFGLVALKLSPVSARTRSGEPCAKANARMEATGRGDSDGDGLSDCAERKVSKTNARDFDSDDDEVSDADEVDDGTNPNEPDTDHDGLNDGREDDIGTDPLKTDTDLDGTPDGSDGDPANDMKSEIAGTLQAITCPTGGAAGSLTVLGINIALTANTKYDGVTTCAALAAKFAALGGKQVALDVSGQGCGGLVAVEVDLDDIDGDGSPNDVDEDDDNDGTPDDDDTDANGDGIPDGPEVDDD